MGYKYKTMILHYRLYKKEKNLYNFQPVTSQDSAYVKELVSLTFKNNREHCVNAPVLFYFIFYSRMFPVRHYNPANR